MKLEFSQSCICNIYRGEGCLGEPVVEKCLQPGTTARVSLLVLSLSPLSILAQQEALSSIRGLLVALDLAGEALRARAVAEREGDIRRNRERGLIPQRRWNNSRISHPKTELNR